MDENLIARASILIKSPREKVWNALVTPEAIKQYMFGTDVIADWHEGGSIRWRGIWKGKPYEDKGTILQLKPGRTLQYTHFSPLAGQPDTPANYHTVTVELAGEGSQVRVTLSQDHNANAEERDHSKANWEGMLEALKKYIEGDGAGPAAGSEK
jgi:uncharacterized protein YndB with AHSA1/START domain